MALTSAQIIALALQTARVPGFTSQAGQLLNKILDELCQDYDFEVALKTNAFVFNGPTGNQSGPYTLPADYLRTRKDSCFYTIQGVKYDLISVDPAEYDLMVQTAGNNGYPEFFATDMSKTPPVAYFWPPPSGSYPVTQRYYSQMPAIVAPETSAVAPWFPNTNYLQTRLEGELCKLADDERCEAFLSDNEEAHPMGAGVILRKYLRMKDDSEGRAKTVTLDKRRFANNWNALPNTKNIGW